MTTIKIASFNIFKNLPDRKAESDLRDLLAIENLDIAGLQEIVRELDDMLPDMWGLIQSDPKYSRKDPIVYHKALGKPDYTAHMEIIPRIDEKGDSFTPRRFVTIAVWEGQFIVLNLHLNASVEGPPGHPNKNRERVRGNHRGILETIEIADEMQRRYHVPVFITGDFNVDFGADKRVRSYYFPYRNLTRAGFKCCWDKPNKEESTRRRNPNKGRTIDHVWARGTKTHRVVFRDAHTPNRWGPGDPVYSDHLAVVATAKIKRRIFPWLFNWLGKRIKRR